LRFEELLDITKLLLHYLILRDLLLLHPTVRLGWLGRLTSCFFINGVKRKTYLELIEVLYNRNALRVVQIGCSLVSDCFEAISGLLLLLLNWCDIDYGFSCLKRLEREGVALGVLFDRGGVELL